MADDHPYRAEYAKSGRASCKGCKQSIAKDSLRLAVMVQSPHFDGKVPNWFHYMCFFTKQRPKTVDDIAHYEQLRWDDQQKIKNKLGSGDAVDSGKKGGSSKAAAASALKDFRTEYAKSGKSACKVCEEKIGKGEVRLAKKDYESEKAKMFGPMDRWHHVDCFVKERLDLEYYEGGEKMPGFHSLSKADQDMLKQKLRKIEGGQKRKAESNGSVEAKKPKIEDGVMKEMKAQNDLMFKYRDQLKKQLKKPELQEMLEYNNYVIPSGHERLLDTIADGMAFGALKACIVCKENQLRFTSGVGYVCSGNLTEWTACQATTTDPKREPFKIPDELRDEFSFLKKFKGKVQKRIIITTKPSSNSSDTTDSKSKPKPLGKPLAGLKFVVEDNLSISKEELEKSIIALGGKIVAKVSKTVTAVISSKENVDGKGSTVKKAEKQRIQVVPVEFVEEAKGRGAITLINKLNLVPWGDDLLSRVTDPDAPKEKSSASKAESKSMFISKMPDKMKVRLKGGAAVDQESGLEDCSHVVKHKGEHMTSVLCMVDASRGTNSYYKLQALESDSGRGYWLFRSWGRIGTTIGGTKVEDFETKEDLISSYKSLFEEKTGNRWGTKDFQKLPNRFYIMDLDFGDEDQGKSKSLSTKESKSLLPSSVQDLICLIFDVDRMKQALVEFEIDLKKMPLGKLSKKQIEKAYKVLTEAQNLLTSDVKPEALKSLQLDCSNRFFTLIPHDFGMKIPPLLNNETIIKSKIEMLDNLLEIEVAYSLLKSEGEDAKKDPIDQNYEKLKTKIEPIDKSSEDYSLLQDYVKNTHASTHSHYKLEIEEAFTIARSGEKKKYKPFRSLHNRMLLWHGSRVTNYAGILSQGLRIAPPEAPVTGYMFGKGIYFADMVSKSANYCMTNRTNPTGLILVCEVALGNMYERTGAEYVEKLPTGKHSTKGLGRTHPDPSATKKLADGVEIPLGKGVSSNVNSTSLLYNEYIVYDVAQVNIKYLLKLNFKY